MDIATIEALIFGYNMNRLSWSTSGSPLSRHSVNGYGEWVGRDPTDDPSIEKLVENAKKVKLGEQRIFTIVDTFTMTVTLMQVSLLPYEPAVISYESQEPESCFGSRHDFFVLVFW
jgi:hypothetical protein